MFQKEITLLLVVAISSMLIVVPAASADHIETPADRCSGTVDFDCQYCANDGGIYDYSNSSCNDHAFDSYSWQQCGIYVYGLDGTCIVGTFPIA